VRVSAKLPAVRVCLVYDCLFPYTVGGAERWYRNLGERLAAAGHDVTYLTLRQWDRGKPPALEGVRVVVVGPRMKLYAGGRRRILPPLVFGAGVLLHLARHGRRYDIVHTASFPYFSLLAAGMTRRAQGFRLMVDWHEVWTRAYWRQYLGPLGVVGWLVQRLCMRLRQGAFCYSRLHAARLREEGLRGELTVLEGEYTGSLEAAPPEEPEPVVVFAGRHIPEKRVPALVPAIAHAAREIPGLRAELYGDGPDRAAVLRAIAAAGLKDTVVAPGFIDLEAVDTVLRRALCMVLPSQREGYGMIVVEAVARGTPAVVVAAADNAATELVEEGVNGFVAPSASPTDLAEAIVKVHRGGFALRESTSRWFSENARRLSLEASLEVVVSSYERSGS
jgi:glycosyltransferase involved in cell wall biosynthesis